MRVAGLRGEERADQRRARGRRRTAARLRRRSTPCRRVRLGAKAARRAPAPLSAGAALAARRAGARPPAPCGPRCGSRSTCRRTPASPRSSAGRSAGAPAASGAWRSASSSRPGAACTTVGPTGLRRRRVGRVRHDVRLGLRPSRAAIGAPSRLRAALRGGRHLAARRARRARRFCSAAAPGRPPSAAAGPAAATCLASW